MYVYCTQSTCTITRVRAHFTYAIIAYSTAYTVKHNIITLLPDQSCILCPHPKSLIKRSKLELLQFTEVKQLKNVQY